MRDTEQETVAATVAADDDNDEDEGDECGSHRSVLSQPKTPEQVDLPQNDNTQVVDAQPPCDDRTSSDSEKAALSQTCVQCPPNNNEVEKECIQTNDRQTFDEHQCPAELELSEHCDRFNSGRQSFQTSYENRECQNVCSVLTSDEEEDANVVQSDSTDGDTADEQRQDEYEQTAEMETIDIRQYETATTQDDIECTQQLLSCSNSTQVSRTTTITTTKSTTAPATTIDDDNDIGIDAETRTTLQQEQQQQAATAGTVQNEVLSNRLCYRKAHAVEIFFGVY